MKFQQEKISKIIFLIKTIMITIEEDSSLLIEVKKIMPTLIP